MNAGGARLLGDTGDQLFDLLADHHHHVGELVDDDDDVRHRLQARAEHWAIKLGVGEQIRNRRQRIGNRLAGLDRVEHFLVQAGEVAHAECRHQPVAALHLSHTPAQCVGGVLHVGDHRRQQMRNALVHGQFQHLRIDQDQAQLLGRGLEQHRQDHGVDRHRLAGPGGTRDQQMRHLRHVHGDRIAGDVLAHAHGQRRGGAGVGVRCQNLRQADHLALLVGNLQAYDALAFDDLDHTDAGHRHHAREIARQIGDLRTLHTGRRLQLETGDHRARHCVDDGALDAEAGQMAFQLTRQAIDFLSRIAATARFRRIEQVQRRQRLAVERWHDDGIRLRGFLRLRRGHHQLGSGRDFYFSFGLGRPWRRRIGRQRKRRRDHGSSRRQLFPIISPIGNRQWLDGGQIEFRAGQRRLEARLATTWLAHRRLVERDIDFAADHVGNHLIAALGAAQLTTLPPSHRPVADGIEHGQPRKHHRQRQGGDEQGQ